MKYTNDGFHILEDGRITASAWAGEKNAARLAAKLDAVEAMRKALKAYERWEADLVLSDEAWRGGMAPLPTITQSLWDRLLEIQAMRNAALGRVKEVTP